VLGGALAGIFGAGAAKVAGIDAKGKGKGKQHSKGKGKGKNGKVKNQFTCTAANANNPPPNGCGPLACCASTGGGLGPNCVDFGAQAGGSLCGQVGTGIGVCRTCPAGTRCSGFPLFRCVCDSTSCKDGCCISNIAIDPTLNDTCVQNGSGTPVSSPNPQFDGSFVCGTGGSQCNVCSLGTIFAGCCTSTGTCSAGTANTACGSGGKICEVCTNDASCGADQACTGATTTTTTTTTAAPGPCSDGRARCGPQQVCCASGFTCSGDSCAQNRKKRKKRKKHHHKH
jgi:hypothetical protein